MSKIINVQELEENIMKDIAENSNGIPVKFVTEKYNVTEILARKVLNGLVNKASVVKVRTKLGYYYLKNN